MLLQAPDPPHSIERNSDTSESDLDTDSSMPGLLNNETSTPSDTPSSSSSESNSNTYKSSSGNNRSHQPKVIRKKTYVKTRKGKAPDGHK